MTDRRWRWWVLVSLVLLVVVGAAWWAGGRTATVGAAGVTGPAADVATVTDTATVTEAGTLTRTVTATTTARTVTTMTTGRTETTTVAPTATELVTVTHPVTVTQPVTVTSTVTAPAGPAGSSSQPSSTRSAAPSSTSRPSGTASASGVPVPTADLPGWTLVFTDDFDRTELGDDWGAYSGSPGGDPYSHWDPSHVELDGSALRLAGYREDGRWVTGGVSNWPVSQVYGRWEVRFRAEQSDEITYHFLLWPQAESWPPEIDFLEDMSGDRSRAAGFLHYLDGGRRQMVQKDVTADFTQWHTAGVIWEPGKVTYLLDGEPWATISGDMVPAEPMWMGLQAQSGGCERNADFGFPSCPRAGVPDRADVIIDWVAVYRRG